MKKSLLLLLLALAGSLSIKNSVYSQRNPTFLSSPNLIKTPGQHELYSPENRKFTGIPSLAVTASGTLWAVWYAGISPGEDENNYVVVANSHDQGSTWKEVLVIDPDREGPVRAFDPEVWMDPEGQLWIFWAQGYAGKIQEKIDGKIAGVWAITLQNDDHENPVWSKPYRITDGVMMCKPTVLKNGEWLLPVSTWYLTENSAKVVSTINGGLRWNIKGAAHVPEEIRTFDEHMIVEKDDGALLLWARTKSGIGESTSRDGGKTWSSLQKPKVEHPSARFFIRKLASGNLLVVKHGPIQVRTGRSHLMAFISQDDGNTWSRGLLLDERPSVSYPDGQQTEDGPIYIAYDYSRTGEQKIYLTSFTEDDILSPKYDESMLKVFNNRKIISDGGQ